MLDIKLSGYNWRSCIVYVDYFILFSSSLDDQLPHVYIVLEVLRGIGMTVRLEKCRFFAESVHYLGHVVRAGRLEVTSEITEAVAKARPPRTYTEVWSFLGLCNVHRRFGKHLATVAAMLAQLTSKKYSMKLPP